MKKKYPPLSERVKLRVKQQTDPQVLLQIWHFWYANIGKNLFLIDEKLSVNVYDQINNKIIWLRLFQPVKPKLPWHPIDHFRPTETPSFLVKTFQAIWLRVTLPSVNWTCSTKSEEFDNVSMKLLLTIYSKREAVSINMAMNCFHPHVNLMGRNEWLVARLESIGQRTDQ